MAFESRDGSGPALPVTPQRLRRAGIASLTVLALGLPTAGAWAATSILFIGNSFTYGQGSVAQTYMPGNVTDLNGTNVAGLGSVFKAFTVQAGLDYNVSVETQPGIGLDWHYNNRLAVLDKAWDKVVMHGQSTLDFGNPGNPANITTYGGLLADTFLAKNANVDISYMATWARADQTYLPSGFWYGQPISAMAQSVQAGYESALAANAGKIDRVIPVGLAWDRAINVGVADPNPYDAPSGLLNLWTTDSYHASKYGTYLEALTVFGTITGVDPRTLGGQEQVALDFGITAGEAFALQSIAYTQIQAAAVPEPSTWLLMSFGVGVIAWARRRSARSTETV